MTHTSHPDSAPAEPEPLLAELIRYNTWANRELIAACRARAEEGDDLLDSPIPGAFGTVRETLAHIVESELGYVGLITGRRLEPPLRLSDPPTLDEIEVMADHAGRALGDVARSVPLSAPVSERWQGETLRYDARLVFIQVINHGIEHRTNVTTLLQIEDLSPPGVDGWSYLLAHRERFDPTMAPGAEPES